MSLCRIEAEPTLHPASSTVLDDFTTKVFSRPTELSRGAHGWGARGDTACAPLARASQPWTPLAGTSSQGMGIPSDKAGWFHSPARTLGMHWDRFGPLPQGLPGSTPAYLGVYGFWAILAETLKRLSV